MLGTLILGLSLASAPASGQVSKQPSFAQRTAQSDIRGLGYTGRTRPDEICLVRKSTRERECRSAAAWRRLAQQPANRR